MLEKLSTPLEKLIAIEKDAREFGFDWPNQEMIIEQAISECDEIREAIATEPPSRVQEEIGDLLHTAVSLCLFSGFDVDQTIAATVNKFESRMNALKAITKEHGFENLKGQSLKTMLKFWHKAKIKSNK